MSPRFTIDRELIVRIFFFVAFAFLLTQVFLLARPFLPSVLFATILALMFFPIYRRLRRVVRNRELSALLMTGGVVLAGLLPLVAFTWILVHESGNLIPVVQNVLAQINSGDLEEYRNKIPAAIYPSVERVVAFLNGVNIDVKGLVLENARQVGAWISAIGGIVARNAFLLVFKFLILVISLFFMFRDGEDLLAWIVNLLPMEPSHKKAVARSTYETFWAVAIGVLLTAAAQGLTAMIGFFIAGVRMPVLLGLATTAVALLGASFVVCLPVALFTMVGDTGRGIFLLLWGAVLVGWLDNLLKPMLIGSRARMPFVLVFFSILGGLKLYGLVGLLLGPILVACVLTFIRIYRETYDI